jgi:hypothetical protein
VTLNSVIVQNNSARASGGGVGGAIFSSGALTLEDGTVIRNNSAIGEFLGTAGFGTSGYGGGIYVAGGTAVLNNVTVSSNTALGGKGHPDPYGNPPSQGGSGLGGGIYVAAGNVTISSSTLSSNTAQGGDNSDQELPAGLGGDGLGGALAVAGGTVTISGSTLSSNVVQGGEGFGSGGNGFGGALDVSAGIVSLASDSITNNNAVGGLSIGGSLVGGQVGLGSGGGIYSVPTFYVDASTLAIVVNNTASSGTAYDDIVGAYMVGAYTTPTLLIVTAPANVKSGAAFSLTVTVEDAYGNVVTGFVGTVHFSSSDSTATLPADYTFTAADAGVHTFTNLTTLRKKAKQTTITVTDLLDSPLTITDDITVK